MHRLLTMAVFAIYFFTLWSVWFVACCRSAIPRSSYVTHLIAAGAVVVLAGAANVLPHVHWLSAGVPFIFVPAVVVQVAVVLGHGRWWSAVPSEELTTSPRRPA